MHQYRRQQTRFTQPLEDWANTKKDRQLTEEVEYVHHKRVEIDSVLAALNNNAIFWQFIRFKLQERFPTRNYNRAIDILEYVIPDCVEELNDIVREKAFFILKERPLYMHIENGCVGIFTRKRGKRQRKKTLGSHGCPWMLLIIGCTHTLFAKKLTSGAKKEGTTAKNWPEERVCYFVR